MTVLDPREVLDIALGQPPGVGLSLTFPTREARDRFRWRCYAAMGVEARQSKRELSPVSPGWGKHPWQEVVIKRKRDLVLWLGRTLDTEIVLVEGVPETEEEDGDG